jgi:glycogen/starch synthase, ADP-glucose type
MKGALCYSDLLSTVSPSYAHEIQEPFFGEHMNDIFSRRNNVLYGILNGINTDFYSPEKDTLIEKNFAKNDMAGKAECKKALQDELGFEENPDIPIITMIGRLTEQKGMDLLTNVFDELLNQPVQIAILGTGDWQYEETVRYFAGKYPGKLAALTMFDEALSHRLYAGADMLLMPSLFEPCGLSQMIAMHYGTLPIVREVGGLKDSVKPYNQYTGEGTGFSFANYNAHEMLYTIKDAITLYYDNKEAWKKLQEQAMSEDFSWNNAAERYIEMYERLHPEIPVVVEEVEENEVAKEKPVKETEAEITGVHNTDIEKEAAKEEADKKEVAEAAGIEAAGVEAAGVEVASAEKVTAKKEETEKETVKKATTKKTAAKKATTRKASTSKTTATKAVSEAKQTETEPVEAKQTDAKKTTRKSAAKKSETASTATKQTKARSTRAKSTQAKKTDTVSADDKDE